MKKTVLLATAILFSVSVSASNNFDSRPDDYMGAVELTTIQNQGMCFYLEAAAGYSKTGRWLKLAKKYQANSADSDQFSYGEGYGAALVDAKSAYEDRSAEQAGRILAESMNCDNVYKAAIH